MFNTKQLNREAIASGAHNNRISAYGNTSCADVLQGKEALRIKGRQASNRRGASCTLGRPTRLMLPLCRILIF